MYSHQYNLYFAFFCPVVYGSLLKTRPLQDWTTSTLLCCQVPTSFTVWACDLTSRCELNVLWTPPESWRTGRLQFTWLKHISDDLTSFDRAQNRCVWTLLASHSVVHSWCMLIMARLKAILFLSIIQTDNLPVSHKKYKVLVITWRGGGFTEIFESLWLKTFLIYILDFKTCAIIPSSQGQVKWLYYNLVVERPDSNNAQWTHTHTKKTVVCLANRSDKYTLKQSFAFPSMNWLIVQTGVPSTNWNIEDSSRYLLILCYRHYYY